MAANFANGILALAPHKCSAQRLHVGHQVKFSLIDKQSFQHIYIYKTSFHPFYFLWIYSQKQVSMKRVHSVAYVL